MQVHCTGSSCIRCTHQVYQAPGIPMTMISVAKKTDATETSLLKKVPISTATKFHVNATRVSRNTMNPLHSAHTH